MPVQWADIGLMAFYFLMKQHGILFSTPMVAAILSGTKTQTRRTHGLEEVNKAPDTVYRPVNALPGFVPGTIIFHFNCIDEGMSSFGIVPKYQPGDVLFVRETHYRYGTWVETGEEKINRQPAMAFVPNDILSNIRFHENPPKVINKGQTGTGWYKRPSLFLPKTNSRIWLKVEDVNAERLQAISEVDAINEGVLSLSHQWVRNQFTEYAKLDSEWTMLRHKTTPPPLGPGLKTRFMALWQSINGPASLAANPWVFAYTFSVISTTGKP